MDRTITRLQERGVTRRELLGSACATALSLATARVVQAEPDRGNPVRIVDSHVHVWDLKQFRLPWLDHDPLLNRDFSVADYREAAAGLNVTSAVYVEVNVEPGQRGTEARYVAELCRKPDSIFAAGVIAADPRDPGLGEFLDRFRDRSELKGVRFLYPRDGSRDPLFLRGVRLLGERKMTFDLQLGPPLLADAAAVVAACPETQFVLDHCGGAVPKPFRREFDNDPAVLAQRDTWRRGIEGMAKHSNVACKISGVADAAMPGDATAEDVAPLVNFCLDQFGPDRVLFGGNWPVCLKGSTLRHWVESLKTVVAQRSAADQQKLFRENALRVYRVVK